MWFKNNTTFKKRTLRALMTFESLLLGGSLHAHRMHDVIGYTVVLVLNDFINVRLKYIVFRVLEQKIRELRTEHSKFMSKSAAHNFNYTHKGVYVLLSAKNVCVVHIKPTCRRRIQYETNGIHITTIRGD